MTFLKTTILIFAVCILAQTLRAQIYESPKLERREAAAIKEAGQKNSAAEKIAVLKAFCEGENRGAASCYNLGCLYAQEQDFKAAAKCFKTATEIMPRFFFAAKNLVFALEKSGASDAEIFDALSKALALSGIADKDLLNFAARKHLQRGEYSAALEAAALAQTAALDNIEGALTQTRVFIETQEYAKAAQVQRSLLDKNPKNADAWELLFLSLAKNSEFEEAAAVWEASAKFAAQKKSRRNIAAKVYFQLGLYDDCARLYSEILKDGKSSPENRELLDAAKALFMARKYAVAENLCDGIFASDKFSRSEKTSALETRLESMLARSAAGREIKSMYEKILARDASSTVANFARARETKKSGRVEEALEAFDSAAVCAENAQYKRASLLGKAACLIELGRTREALRILKKLNAETPSKELEGYIESIEKL